MATLQQTPITFQSRSLLSTRITANFHPHRTLKMSSFGGFLSLRIPKLAGKSRPRRGGVVKMAESASGPYATALAEVAASNHTLEATTADLEKVEKIFSDPSVCDFFDNPTVEEEKKQALIEEICSSAKLLPHVANFLNILLDSKRITLIKEIVKEFEVMYNKMTHTELATVTSVVKLESRHLAQIAKTVQSLTGAKNVRIKTEIDPSLVAGFTVRYGHSGSKLIDMSVKKQLEEIATQLVGEVQLTV